jgi:hypothetical protein
VSIFKGRDGQAIPIDGLYNGASCFLIVSGPSLLNYDLSKLNAPGVITFGVNNSPKVFRPTMWTSVDSPQKFLLSIWRDPRIMKFVPDGKPDRHLFDNWKWEVSDIKVKDCPNVVYYPRNDRFQAATFLTEPTVNWGSHKQFGGKRSVMLAALRLIYQIGCRRVFLLGCDFNMREDKQYAWSQIKHPGGIKGNNKTYARNIDRFTELRPIFEQAGFFVYQCYKESALQVFPYISYESALAMTAGVFYNTASERADGLYERKHDEEE